MTLAVNRLDGHGHFNTARSERLPKKTKVTRYYVATKGLPVRRSVSFIKVSERMCNDIPYSGFYLRGPNFCEICEVLTSSQILIL